MSRVPRRRIALGLSAVALLCACTLAISATAEQSSHAGLFVSFNGSYAPSDLPRHRLVPISLTLEGGTWTRNGPPPRLRQVDLAFGARGGLDTVGLPACPRSRLRN